MPRKNQISVDHHDGQYTCISCDRDFNSERSLLQHCQTATIHRGEWCNRCEWLFVTSDARDDHVDASSHHWACHLCHEDMPTIDSLVRHEQNVHSYCRDCNMKFYSYVQHRIDRHHRCPQCDREFDNDNNRTMHSQVHLPANKECYGCTRQFTKHSAIMIHLESGTCACRVYKKLIDQWAFDCCQSKHYTNDWDDVFRFQCPSCQTDFEHVSGLFQHVESPACDAGYDGAIGKLRKFLINKVGRFEASSSEWSDSS